MTTESPLNDPFNLHLLFDPYIAHNIGNNPLTALNKFTEAIDLFYKNNPKFTHSPTLQLLNTSLDIESIISKMIIELQNLNNEHKETDKFDSYLMENKNASKRSESIIKTIKAIGNILLDQKNIPKTHINEYIEELKNITITLEKIKLQLISVYIDVKVNDYTKQILNKFVELVVIKFYNELIIPGGYHNLDGGHLVGLYYNNTTMVIANSGEGVSYHKKQNQLYEIILEKNTIKSAIIIALTNNYLARIITNQQNTIWKFYENVVYPIFNKNYTSDIQNDKYYHKPQLSGSCTFFGLYYIIYYLYLKREDESGFNYFIEYTKSRVTDEIITYLLDNKISSNDKNYIDLLKLSTKNKDKQLDTIYEKYVIDTENYTKYDNNRNTFSTEYILNKNIDENEPIYNIINFTNQFNKESDILEIINLLYGMVNNLYPRTASWMYLTNLYMILKILTIIYKREDIYEYFRKLNAKIQYEYIIKILEIINIILSTLNDRFIKYKNTDKSNHFYIVECIHLLCLNIIIKINNNMSNRILIQENENNTDKLVNWINSVYGISNIYNISMYELVNNMKNYQHYIPIYNEYKKNFVLDNNVIIKWAELKNNIIDNTHYPVPTVISKELKYKPNYYKQISERSPYIIHFFNVICDSFYKTIFDIFFSLFVYNNSDNQKIFSFENIFHVNENMEYTEGVLIYYNIYTDNHIFVREKHKLFTNKPFVNTTFFNDILVSETINHSSVDSANMTLENFQLKNISYDNRKLLENIDESYIVAQNNTDVIEFDIYNSNSLYYFTKYQLNNFEINNLDKYSPNVLSTILILDYIYNKKYYNTTVSIKILEIITNLDNDIIKLTNKYTENEILYLNHSITYEEFDNFDKQLNNIKLHTTILKIIYTLMTNSNDYLEQISKSFYKLCIKQYGKYSYFNNSNESVIYGIFMLYLMNNLDKLQSIIMYERTTFEYSNLFSEYLLKKNIKINSILSIVDDKQLGQLIKYEIIKDNKSSMITLIDQDNFMDFSMYKKYYFYIDHDINKTIATSENNELPDLEIILEKDSYNIYKLGTNFEIVKKVIEKTSGLVNELYNKFNKITDQKYITYYDTKSNIIKIQLLKYNITFIITQSDNKVYFNDYEIITNTSLFCYNRFISDIYNAFLLVKNNQYKILLLDRFTEDLKNENLLEIDKIFNSNWINDNTDKIKYSNKILLEFNRTKYHLIDIHYTSLYPIFTTLESFRSYIYYCILYNKTNCLYTLYNQHLQYYTNTTSDTYDYLLHLYSNTPYKYYFLNKTGLNKIREYTFGIYDSFEYNYNNRIKYYPERFLLDNVQLDNYKPILYNIKYDKPLKNINNNLFEEKPFVSDENLLKSINSIDTKYGNYIKAFSEDYKDCTLKTSKIDEESLKILKIKFKNHIIDNLALLSKQFDKNIITTTNFIYSYYETIYELIEYNKMLKIVDTIEILCNLNNKCECQELRRIRDILNTDVIYSGERSIQIMLFEVLFGSFIRKDQYKIYIDIINNFNKNNYMIYQMLMGEGKTSVLAPLLIFTYIVNHQFGNIISIMPEHLIEQSYETLVNYSIIMDNCNIIKLKVDRDNNYSISNKFVNDTKKVHVLIMDDNSFKSIKLNEIEYRQYITNIIKNNSICIIDEIDSIIDPLTSELNYPLEFKKIDSYISNLLIYFVSKILSQNFYKYINFTTQEQSEIFINKIFNESLKDYNLNYKDELVYFVDKYVNNKIVRSDKLNYTIVGYIRKVYITLISSLMMIYNKDYGFGRNIKNYEKNYMLAIPYKAVNDPVDKSEYTDTELTICLTILTYYYSGLRNIDLIKILEFISSSIKKYKHPQIMNILYKNLKIILEKYDFTFNNIITDKREDFISSLNKLNFDYELIEFYLKHIILPTYIELTHKQLNCSFVDVITSQFAKHKIAFSGTVNILLPQLTNYDHEFKDIIDSDKANGSIISAITGFINKNKLTYIDKNTDLNHFFDIITKNKYNVIVDVGAFFKNYTAFNFISQLAKYIDDKRKYIFIDENDKKLVYDNDTKEVYKLPEIIYSTDEIFIYYDNKHTVGIDIKQPYYLNVAVTISWNDTLTKVGQGIYRARNTNYGHHIDFLIDTTININNIPLNNTVDLLKFLKHNEQLNTYKSYNSYLLQNIKYLIRNKSQTKENYTDIVFRENIITEEDLSKNMYIEYIQTQYCNKIDTLLCDQLINRLQYKTFTQSSKQQQKEIIKEIVIETTLDKQIERRYKPNFNINELFTDFTIYIIDYLNVTDNITNIVFSKLSNKLLSLKYLNTINIFISPILIHKIISDKTSTISELYNYNFYYIKYFDKKSDNIKYLLISPDEMFTIMMYLSNIKNKDQYDIVIKHKFGHIKYKSHIEDISDKNEILVQMILAKKLNYTDYLQIFDQIIINDSYKDFEILIVDIANIYGYNILNKSFINYFMTYKNNYRTQLLTLCNPMNINKLFEILDINIDSNILTLEEKQTIIKNTDFLNCISFENNILVGGFKKYKLI